MKVKKKKVFTTFKYTNCNEFTLLYTKNDTVHAIDILSDATTEKKR